MQGFVYQRTNPKPSGAAWWKIKMFVVVAHRILELVICCCVCFFVSETACPRNCCSTLGFVVKRLLAQAPRVMNVGFRFRPLKNMLSKTLYRTTVQGLCRILAGVEQPTKDCTILRRLRLLKLTGSFSSPMKHELR